MKELPPSTKHIDVLAEFADALRANPGDWREHPRVNERKVYNREPSIASRINCGRSKTFPSTEFEAAVRNGLLYVRARKTADVEQRAA